MIQQPDTAPAADGMVINPDRYWYERSREADAEITELKRRIAEKEAEIGRLKGILQDTLVGAFDELAKQPAPIDKSEWRQWTAADMRDGIEVVINGSVSVITFWNMIDVVFGNVGPYSFAYLFKCCTQPNGDRCGVRKEA